jgi:hypothetical protein
MGEASRLVAMEPYGEEFCREPSRARRIGVFLEAMLASSRVGSRLPSDGSVTASLRREEAGSWPEVMVEDEAELEGREGCKGRGGRDEDDDEDGATADAGSLVLVGWSGNDEDGEAVDRTAEDDAAARV